MTHNESYLLGAEPVLVSNNNCFICGLVVWNTQLHLDYSHSKRKMPCQLCGQSGRGLVSINSMTGFYTVSKCGNCNGTGYFELKERM